MALTKKQLKEIQDIIKKRILRFSYEALGENSLTSGEINALKDAGLLPRSTRNMIGDAHILGRIGALAPEAARYGISYDSVLRAAKRLKPLTDVEQKMIQFAQTSAGEHIQRLSDYLLRTTSSLSARASSDTLMAVQDGVAQAIANRQTISELRTQLFNLVDNQARDWQRVAHTEMNNAIQNGIYHEIREKSSDGSDQLVFRRPNPDACEHCKRLYLEEDGITPKVFKLSDLAASNIGKKAKDWDPVIGSTHPWCACQTIVLPDKHDFAKKRVAAEAFSANGKSYKAGQVISEAEFNALSSDEKKKTREDAVLEFTGRTVSVRKSEIKKSHSEIGNEDCICEH